MMRLFLRIFYMTFLWIILIANLLFSFDLVQIISPLQGGIYNGDISTRYFGVSTLIDFFKHIDETRLGKFALGLGKYQKSIFNTISGLKSNVENFSTAIETPTDILGFLRNIVRILGIVANVVGMIGSYIYAFGVTMVYYTTMFFELMFMIISLFSGYYSSSLPSTVSQAVSNCITPLLSAV